MRIEEYHRTPAIKYAGNRAFEWVEDFFDNNRFAGWCNDVLTKVEQGLKGKRPFYDLFMLWSMCVLIIIMAPCFLKHLILCKWERYRASKNHGSEGK